MEEISFAGLKMALKKRRIKANYGFDPRLGKYHLTACTRCYEIFTPKQAQESNMKCSCGGIIKKGVNYRISEISTWKRPHHPYHRPPYIHIMPLAEIISLKFSKGVTTKFVQDIWENLINNLGSEIDVMIRVPIEDIKEISPEMAPVIQAFRDKTLVIVPGGGGKYGEIKFPENNLDNYI
jgi:uncharacterized protein (TIGR00375 family)